MMVTRFQIPEELNEFFEPAQSAFASHDWLLEGPEREPRSMRRREFDGQFCQNCGGIVLYVYGGHPFVASLRMLKKEKDYDMSKLSRMLIEAGFSPADVCVPHSLDCGAFAKAMWPEVYLSSVIQ